MPSYDVEKLKTALEIENISSPDYKISRRVIFLKEHGETPIGVIRNAAIHWSEVAPIFEKMEAGKTYNDFLDAMGLFSCYTKQNLDILAQEDEDSDE